MANILQVTTPNVNTDNRNVQNPLDPKHNAENPAIRNPVDPTRVVRADGRDGQQAENSAQNDLFSGINFESNYGAFIKSLGENSGLAGALGQLLFTDISGMVEAGHAEIGALVDQFLMTLKMDSPEELMKFMQGQQELQARFTGDFFAQLRSVLSQTNSEGLKDAVMAFLKGYNNFSSGTHLLQQMDSLTKDIEQLLLRPYREEFRQLAGGMDFQAANGNTQANAAQLNGRLIPFLANYISHTHDYGAVRDATMLLIFNAVRYQEGSTDRPMKLFDRMADNQEFARLFKGDLQASLQKLLEPDMSATKSMMSDFADGLAKLLLRGANGEAGLENVQQFYTIMNGMLVNESVYMPLLHFILPFQFEDNNVVSEMWVDPDAKHGSDGGRKVKLFLKFDIQSLGKFELVMTLQDHESKMQLFVPTFLAKQDKKIQTDVSSILKKNGIRLSQCAVYGRVRDRKIDEVFPEIRAKENTINVRI